jgi:hypothetical protein
MTVIALQDGMTPAASCRLCSSQQRCFKGSKTWREAQHHHQQCCEVVDLGIFDLGICKHWQGLVKHPTASSRGPPQFTFFVVSLCYSVANLFLFVNPPKLCYRHTIILLWYLNSSQTRMSFVAKEGTRYYNVLWAFATSFFLWQLCCYSITKCNKLVWFLLWKETGDDVFLLGHLL